MRRCCPRFLWPLALPLLCGGVRADDLPLPSDPPAPSAFPPQELAPPEMTPPVVPEPPVPVPAPPPEPPAPRATFAQALAAVAPPKLDLFLTVDAENVLLPPDAAPASPDDRPGQVAEAYGRQVRPCGAVMALGPPTMTVLTTSPGTPNAFEGMPPDHALILLLGSLSYTQWQALTSEPGLSISDLFEGSQRDYFRQIFPSGELSVSTQSISGTSAQLPTLKAEDLFAARLRLGQQVQIGIPIPGQPSSFMTTKFPPPSGQAQYPYEAWSIGPSLQPDTTGGVTLRQRLTNNPKLSDLDWKASAFDPFVPTTGITTVRDLIARISAATGLEVYADRRYEKRTVILLGRSSARAGDLLRALAFCVAGAYRKVGPAYVLTDDVQGLIPRRQTLARFTQKADIARRAALAAAGDRLLTERGVDDLPSLDGLALNDDQRARGQRQNVFPMIGLTGEGSSATLSFTDLTPAQQEYVGGRQGLNGQFSLATVPVLLLYSPAAPGPVILSYPPAATAYRPSYRLRMELDRKRQAGQDPVPLLAAGPLPSAPPPLTQLARYPRRAVTARPRTVAEVDALIASMKALGLNQLWLDVFYDGRLHCDPPKGGGPDILTEALARTKGTGIVVMPTLDLLDWGAATPPAARDLTPAGESFAQAQEWQQHYSNLVEQGMTEEEDAKLPQPEGIWACPAAPPVQKVLLEAVRWLASTPGVAVLVLRQTAPPGYEYAPDAGGWPIPIPTANAEGGFTPDLRLAFLRRDHVDPLDLGIPVSTPTSLNLFVPGFDDDWTAQTKEMKEALADWNSLRYAAVGDLLQRLLAVGREAGGPHLRFLVNRRTLPEARDASEWVPSWYGLWDDPRAPLPQMRSWTTGVGNTLPLWATDLAAFEHSQRRINVYQLNSRNTWSLATLAEKLRWATFLGLGQKSPSQMSQWDGIVLSLLTGPSANPIADLAQEVTPQAAKAGSPHFARSTAGSTVTGPNSP